MVWVCYQRLYCCIETDIYYRLSRLRMASMEPRMEITCVLIKLLSNVLIIAKKYYYGVLSLLNFISLHLLHNSAGAFCVRLKILSSDLSKELTWTQQNPRDSSPLKSSLDVRRNTVMPVFFFSGTQSSCGWACIGALVWTGAISTVLTYLTNLQYKMPVWFVKCMQTI